ncbi:hypothetical protein HDU82_008120 [Entophlyctis luteolus]|nr:hypothetical protein HDU82_008120 [Entophlyctis luteolus]
MSNYSIGLDFGTNSCRALLIDLTSGNEVAHHVSRYASGTNGILKAKDPLVARQRPSDHVAAMVACVRGVLQTAACAVGDGFHSDQVVGIGVATTGSSVIPVDASGTPLGMLDEFRDDLDAQAWLWKDHSSHVEANEITELASSMHPEYLAACGGSYSPEWFWSKILHMKRVNPVVFRKAHSFLEHCDWIPGLLVGVDRAEAFKRSICPAGHKAMFSESWGGLPSEGFLAALDPDLASVRQRLYSTANSVVDKAGALSSEWATKLGLSESTVVSVGSLDAHLGAIGAKVKEGRLVKIMGTSTCDLMLVKGNIPNIDGLSGIVNGSVIPGFYGLEAGQSAVGDIFLWFVENLVPEKYGMSLDAKFESLNKAAASLKAGESGLLALDWNNGVRSILADPRLSGLVLGQTLGTEAHEIYRALIESTAFGALNIIRQIENAGFLVEEVMCCGGLAENGLLMQIYANVLNRRMVVAKSSQCSALGAAIVGAVVSGTFSSLSNAQALIGDGDCIYYPDIDDVATYVKLYELYCTLHDGFGRAPWTGSFSHVMKELLDIRNNVKHKLENI